MAHLRNRAHILGYTSFSIKYTNASGAQYSQEIFSLRPSENNAYNAYKIWELSPRRYEREAPVRELVHRLMRGAE